MRGLALLALIAAPAFAQDVVYDAAVLDSCLEDAAREHAQTDIEAEPLRACIGAAAMDCMQGPEGGTTVGMVDCLSRETGQWDGLLNRWYGQALAQAEEGDAALKDLGSAAPPAAPVLRDAQRGWIAFRDKSCEFESVRWQGGTLGGPASGDCMLRLTAEQALRLKAIAESEGR